MKERFDAKVRVTPGCWLWSASFMSNGYGAFAINRKMSGAHRVSYSLYIGSIPDGQHVLHRCDNKKCVNPEHLFLGSHEDNMRDKENKGRANHPMGDTHVKARLTAEDVKKIRNDPRTMRAISNEYGVPYSTVRQAKQGKTWKHV